MRRFGLRNVASRLEQRLLRRLRGSSGDVLAKYVRAAPSPQNALDLFAGEWTCRLPPPFEDLQAGTAELFDDGRVHWADGVLGGFEGKTVLELGPLEGAHSALLEKLGAAKVTAIEANGGAFMRCLVVKEILDLRRCHFKLGDFVAYLEQPHEPVDVCLACGVLYHMKRPLELIEAISKVADAVVLWTHYYDREKVSESEAVSAHLQGEQSATFRGRGYTLHRYVYGDALQWQGFCGGSAESANWVSRETLLMALNEVGFSDIETSFDEPDHVNGPAINLVARKPRT